MREYELLKETWLRKSYILAIHIIWMAFYPLLFFILERDSILGKVPFVFSGCMLPLIISSGIFGDDIASGRINVLIAKPMRISELYIWRFIGLATQGIIHLSIVGIIIFLLQRATGIGNTKHLILWLLLSWMLFNTWAALSTTLSTFTKRGHNFMFLIFGIVLTIVLRNFLLMSTNSISKTTLTVIKYVFPPVELLYTCGSNEWTLLQKVLLFGHIIGIVVLYAGIGITILANRDFRQQCD